MKYNSRSIKPRVGFNYKKNIILIKIIFKIPVL